jgi:hypothetical protein
MKARQIFFTALAIHTSIPLISGVVLFWAYLAIGSLEMAPNNSPEVKAIVAQQSAFQRVERTLGLLLLVALIAFLGQILPCLATALLLALLALWLVRVSKALYFVVSVLIGTSVAALWFFEIGGGGLHGIAGTLTAFAAIGFTLSSLIVCSIAR